jgi:hypothetical protein
MEMKKEVGRTLCLAVVFLVFTALASSQSATPAADPFQDMNARFSRLLGVSLDKIKLHYYIVKNGGVVDISAKDPNDSSTIAAIQKYLQNQKDLWEKGKESAVTAVHERPPESAATMRRLRNEITFYMAKTDTGGDLRMFSINDQARLAIQDYMRFEIAEHRTGDSTTADQ